MKYGDIRIGARNCIGKHSHPRNTYTTGSKRTIALNDATTGFEIEALAQDDVDVINAMVSFRPKAPGRLRTNFLWLFVSLFDTPDSYSN